ncbi:protein of unknown function [Pseudomonas sp. JV551A1]|nr:protein of unknown function [Pseudomonas sp. JV551A1]
MNAGFLGEPPLPPYHLIFGETGLSLVEKPYKPPHVSSVDVCSDMGVHNATNGSFSIIAILVKFSP